MQRRQLLKGIAALALSERLARAQTAWAAGSRLPSPGLYRLTGHVRVNGLPATLGQPIQPGDTVSTGENSEAVYIIGQDAYLQREQSQVTIVNQALRYGLRVLSGKLMAVFGKGKKSIETPTATIGIRGTGCYIEAEAEKVYFCLCYGKADIIPTQSPAAAMSLESQHHDAPYYIHASGQQMLVPAGLVNHSDAELILLESLLGRIPPFFGRVPPY